MLAVEDLFRPQAAATAAEELNMPVKPPGALSWAFVGLLAVLVVFGIIVLTQVHISRKETVIGVLQPPAGAARIVAPSGGVMVQVFHREGDWLDMGEPIAVIASDPTLPGGRQLSELLADATADQGAALGAQATAKSDVLRNRQAEMADRRRALLEGQPRLRHEVMLQEQRIKYARESVEAAKTLYDKQLLPALQYRQRQDALAFAEQGLSQLQRQLEGGASEIRQLDVQMVRMQAEDNDAIANIQFGRAQLNERLPALKAEKSVVLAAPVAGRLGALQASAGSAVQAGATVGTVLPRDLGLQAVLWVSSSAIGFVRKGDRVRVMYDAYPYERFGAAEGSVVDVALAPVSPVELQAVGMKSEQPLYMVLVKLSSQDVKAYGRDWTLASGMTLKADIILERQSIFSWLTDGIRGAQRRHVL